MITSADTAVPPRRPRAVPTRIDGVQLLVHEVVADERGTFMELCRHSWLGDEVPLQWNLIVNTPRALRGMHWHEQHTDYITALDGRLTVALVDLRVGSPTEGLIELHELDARWPATVVVPPGVGHGFLSLERSVVMYAVTRYWDLEDEFGFRYDDPDLAIPWPESDCIVSDRDLVLPRLAQAGRRPAYPATTGARLSEAPRASRSS